MRKWSGHGRRPTLWQIYEQLTAFDLSQNPWSNTTHQNADPLAQRRYAKNHWKIRDRLHIKRNLTMEEILVLAVEQPFRRQTNWSWFTPSRQFEKVWDRPIANVVSVSATQWNHRCPVDWRWFPQALARGGRQMPCGQCHWYLWLYGSVIPGLATFCLFGQWCPLWLEKDIPAPVKPGKPASGYGACPRRRLLAPVIVLTSAHSYQGSHW